MGLLLKDLLKSLCCGNGWSYGVFWCFDQRNSMLLTMEDAYCEEEMGAVVNNMLQQVHLLGEGIVGQAALSGKSRWFFSDANCEGCNSAGSTRNNDIYQDDSEIRCQFSHGLKTIAIIPLESRGVMQFGSVEKILEKPQFLDQAKRLLREVENVSGILYPDNAPSSLNSDNCDLNEWFASFCNGTITPVHSDSCSAMKTAYSLMNLNQLADFPSNFPHEKMDPLYLELSHLTHQLQTGIETQVTPSCNPDIQFQQVSSRSDISVEAKTPCIGVCSNGSSLLTALESQFTSEMEVRHYPNVFSAEENTPMSCGYTEQGTECGTSCTALYNAGGLFNAEKLVQQTSLPPFHDSEVGLPESENGQQKFLEHSINKMAPTMDGGVSQSGVTSVSSDLLGDIMLDIPFAQPAHSMQSSITDFYVCGDREKPTQGNDLFEHLALEYGRGQAVDCKVGMMNPVEGGGHMANSAGVSKFVPELDVCAAIGPRRGLFSELGLEELLIGGKSSNNTTNSSIGEQYSTAKRRRSESLLSITEMFPKSQVGLWIDDSYSINIGGGALPAKLKKPEEATKAIRKRARPGESTRPRPKDRQQIQDRIKELRGIIPDGGKCSIDALLDHTIKYMSFLQCMTKYAEKLKQTDEPKLIGKEQYMVPENNRPSGSGATWALEYRDQSAVCPIIVEDLTPPGLMLIEMLCDDRGFFLEIADVIRGFGLNILKGVMEAREDKIWAHFIVEAKTQVTRIEIFWSLVKLLQLASTESINQPGDVMKGRVPLLNNDQQPALPCPISVADTL